MEQQTLEIICTACGAEVFVRRQPLYEGFVKVGVNFVCVSCGHVYKSEDEVPFKEIKRPDIFNADDAVKKIEVFKDDENERSCRYCKHYVVNPFTQRCGLHLKVVEATDICDNFEKTRHHAESA